MDYLHTLIRGLEAVNAYLYAADMYQYFVTSQFLMKEAITARYVIMKVNNNILVC
jgi:hypothetical protein